MIIREMKREKKENWHLLATFDSYERLEKSMSFILSLSELGLPPHSEAQNESQQQGSCMMTGIIHRQFWVLK